MPVTEEEWQVITRWLKFRSWVSTMNLCYDEKERGVL